MPTQLSIFEAEPLGLTLAWCVSYQKDIMPAPAFWYFQNRQCAFDAYIYLKSQLAHVDQPRQELVPKGTPFLDRLHG